MKKVLLACLFVAGFVNLAQAQNPRENGGGAGGQRPNGGGGAGGQKPPTVIPGTANDNNAPKGYARVSGMVSDSTNGQPVEFATVALVSQTTKKPVDGTTSNEKGVFVINRVAAGTYNVVVSFIGYRNKTIVGVEVGEKGEVKLKTIVLSSDVKQLSEVEVLGQKDLVEDKIDRIVYNAEKDITNTGGDATDVLRKVPMLTVDLDGNLQMRGSSNLRVLVNGKPSSIMASNVADALRQIPADMIKSVEVITSPSAKYDAEGTAGIVNIITKKNTLQGLSGSVNTGVGTRGSNLFGNANFRAGKFGSTLNVNSNAGYSPMKGWNERENTPLTAPRSYINQENEGFNNRLFSNIQVGWDYEINKTNSLSGGFRMGNRIFDNKQWLYTAFADNNRVITQQTLRDISSQNRGRSYDGNFEYTRTFKKPQQELTILGLFSRDNGRNDYNLFQYPNKTSNDVNYRERNDNESYNQEITFQADYVQPIKKSTTLELGSKAILRQVSSDFQFYAFDKEKDVYTVVPSRSNVFNYDQKVISSYVTFGYTTASKIGIKIGTRYEMTDIAANFVSTNTSFSQTYDNLIPSIALSKDFKKGHKIKFTYSKRIQRPQIFYLNPFVNRADEKNISYGNPALNPELTDSYEISYNAFVKTSSFTISAYTRQTNNAISSVRNIIENGVSETTFQNVGKNATYGGSFFGSVALTSKWRVSGSVNVYYSTITSATLSNSGIMYNANINSSYQFEKGLSIQGFGFFNSPQVQIQGLQGAFGFYTVGLKKELFKKKGGITLGIDNLFGNLVIKTKLSDPTFSSMSERTMFNQALRVTFNYQFGKMTFTDRKKKKGINNDDAKQGESN